MIKKTIASLLLLPVLIFAFTPIKKWQSKFVEVNKDGSLNYIPDDQGNILPDFSRVVYYYGDIEIPEVSVVKTISPSANA